MSLGVIQTFSEVVEVVEWKIPNFFFLDNVKGEWIDSPHFSLASCTWHLRMYPKGDREAIDCISVVLCRADHDDAAKKVTFSIGIKTNHGIVEEQIINETFEEGYTWSGWPNFLGLGELSRRRHELVPSAAITFTCRIRSETPTSEKASPNSDKVDSQLSTFMGEYTMFHGVIQTFSEVVEVVEWEIPNFFLLDKVKGEWIDSPHFSLASCTWHLRVYPKGDTEAIDCISVVLCRADPDDAAKKVTFSIGVKTIDGIVEEQIINVTFGEFYTWSGWPNFLGLEELSRRRHELVPSAAITFTCRIRCETPTSEKASPNSDKVDSQPSTFMELEGLSSDFKNFLIGEKTCDFTINVLGKEFRVHRSVLSARSPVFLAMFEHDTEEAKTGVLNIPDCNPESFQEFLSFIYAGKVENVSFETAYHLYSTADKYDMQSLKTFCAQCMKLNLSPENVCDVAILADRHSDDQLMSSVQALFNENFLKIFQTPKWSAMLKDIPRLADKLLKKFAPAGLKTS